MKIRVGVSLIQPIFHGKAGWIAGFYYIKNCLNALASLPESETELLEVIAFLPESFDEDLLLPEYSSHSTWLTLIKVPCDDNGDSLELQKCIDANPCDLFFPFNNIPSFHFKGAMISWIPDFQYKHLPSFFNEKDIEARDLTSHFMMECSNSIICSSHSVANDIETFYPSAKNKAKVLRFRSLLSRTMLEVAPSIICNKYDIKKKYFYLPNQFWLHKNHKIVFEAWKQLKLSGYDYLLICTGATTDYRNAEHFNELNNFIVENDLSNHIRILGFIDRKEQIQLFRNAVAVLQPSLFEGWNTSIEDARSLGKTLIVSDIAVHYEQCGNEAYYFDRNDPTALANTIMGMKDTLTGYDKQREDTALQAYQHQAQLFGKELLQLFKFTLSENTVYLENKTREIILRLGSELHYSNALSTKRFDILTSIKKNIIKFAFNNLYKIIKKRFPAKLGNLNQHAPKEFIIPKIYYKPSKALHLPTISIVTPSFKQADFIERTLNSVLDQKYPHLEYIVQDGGSNDGTVEILEKYSAVLKHWSSQKDEGQSHAINLGFEHATGDIMAYLNSDDILLPGSLHYIGEYFTKNPEVDVVYAHRVLINKNDEEIGRWVLPPHESDILTVSDFIPQETLFWRRRIWEKAGGKIDESFEFAMDWDLILRFKNANATFKRLPRFIGAFRVHNQQKTNMNMPLVGQKEIRRLQLQHNNGVLSLTEIKKKVQKYLRQHLIYHHLYRMRLLRY
jgi:glycosyltransferase involved in cell wall biosynthesis